MTATYREITFEYDGANRLIAEHYRDDTGGTPSDHGGNRDVTHGYDAADNRTSQAVHYLTDPDAGPDDSNTFSYNSLNQLTSLAISKPARFGQPAVSKTVNYDYDFNGNRSTRDDGTVSSAYAYDYDQRLLGVTATGQPSYAYIYDYRTRRVGIAADPGGGGSVTNTALCFSGGTSVQERDNGTLTVEYVRGSDLGGGIGGILYTLRGTTPSFTHYNARGDVVAKTDGSSAVTYQATYEAFGTRPDETGSTTDRQKANTKDEDPTGLLNEGFRYRDLESGAFITRDPIGFKDGPNLYAYVHQNPWTKFDPAGLLEKESKKEIEHIQDLIKHRDQQLGELSKKAGEKGGWTNALKLQAGEIVGFHQALINEHLDKINQIESTAKRTREDAKEKVQIAHEAATGVGRPGFGEQLIPIWGAGRASINDFQQGRIGWGTFNAALAASDVFLLRAVVKDIAQVGIKATGSHTWSATSSWLNRQEFRDFPGQELHHWLIPQGGEGRLTAKGIMQEQWGRLVPDAIKNQPWNLMKMPADAAFHDALHGVGMRPFGVTGRMWYGSPTWAKLGATSAAGHMLGRKLDEP